MDLNIKIVSTPERMSTNTLSALISKFTSTIEQSVFKTICSMNKDVSRNQIQKSIYGNVHLDIERVEKGSFILYITGALAGTIASCFYDVIKKRVLNNVTTEDVTTVVNNYVPTIAKNLKNDLESKKKFGALFVTDINVNINYNKKFPEMSINLKLGMPEKEHMPATSEEQIEYIVRIQKIKSNRRDSK